MKLFHQLKNLTVILIILCFASCETSDNHAFTPPSGPEPTAMYLEVMGERYEVTFSSLVSSATTLPLNLRTLSGELGNVDFKVLNYTDFKTISIHGIPAKDGVVSIPFKGYIPKDDQLICEYTTASQKGNFAINFYPDNAPKFHCSGEGVIPGDFYLSFIYQPLIMKVNNAGQLLYYRFEPTDDNGTFQELGCWDFKKHVFDGKSYYSYHAPDQKFAEKAKTGYVPGMRILMDEHYNPVDTIHALRSIDGYLPDGSPLDGHDFYFFSPTHWIASASYVEREVGDTIRAVAYLQEVDNGEVVFDWWSTSHPKMLGWGSSSFDTSYDYVHFNSVDVLPDGNWLLSFRALSSIIKVNRNGAGEILWRVDGEALDPKSSFSGQHYVRYHKNNDEEYITLFDNGNAHDPSITRAMRLHFKDINQGIVSSGENMLNYTSLKPYFTQACGAFQDYGDQGFVMGWGWSTVAGNCTRLVTEYDSNGNEAFRIDRDDEDPMSVDPSYRCVKCP